MNEALFQQVLDNRTKLSGKGKKINTDRAVEMLRKRLTDLETEGYDSEVLMNLMLKRSWIGIKKEWLTMLKPRNLSTTRAVSEATDSLLRSTRMPRAKNKYKQAEAAKKVGRDALEELRKITNMRINDDR